MAADTTASRLARIEEKQDALARKFDDYIARADKRANGDSTRLDQVELAQARQEHITQEVEALKGQFRTWNGINSLGAVIASALALFKN